LHRSRVDCLEPLEARKIKADGKLAGEVRGEIEKADDGVLIIRRIHVELRLKVPEEQRQTAERVHTIYADRCPLYRSVKNSIEVASSLKLLNE
jgi:organic hydroperoxide reductase OsmC/OhrA